MPTRRSLVRSFSSRAHQREQHARAPTWKRVRAWRALALLRENEEEKHAEIKKERQERACRMIMEGDEAREQV